MGTHVLGWLFMYGVKRGLAMIACASIAMLDINSIIYAIEKAAAKHDGSGGDKKADHERR